MRTTLHLLLIFYLTPFIGITQTIEAYPDNSPSLQDFYKMGIPNCDKLWTVDNYTTAFHLLDQIYEMDKFSLPRLESQWSGQFFSKLICFDNFTFLTNSTENIGKRILAFEKIKKIPFRLLVYYIEDVEPAERFGEEVLACYLLDAYIANLGKQLYDELKEQIGVQATQERFKTGYVQVCEAQWRSIDRLLLILERNYSRYDEKVLITFTNKLFFLLPTLLDERFEKDVRTRIRLLEKEHPNARLQNTLRDLRYLL